uniref:Shootin-1 n=1 Tax=Steinernema glaseri TaxID=37863 RepID=A0A1I7ZP48_9BILA
MEGSRSANIVAALKQKCIVAQEECKLANEHLEQAREQLEIERKLRREVEAELDAQKLLAFELEEELRRTKDSLKVAVSNLHNAEARIVI